MSENDGSELEKQKEDLISSSILGKWFPQEKRWRTLIFAITMLAAITIATNSIIRYETSRKVEGQPDNTSTVTTPPATISEPQFIEDRQEAFLSANDCILLITPGNDDALNESVKGLVIEAANKIQAKDNIYVGVYIIPRDESAAGPTVLVRVQHHDETKPNLQWTIREDITLTKIYETYLNFALIP